MCSNMLIVVNKSDCGGRPPQCCGKLMLDSFWLRRVKEKSRLVHFVRQDCEADKFQKSSTESLFKEENIFLLDNIFMSFS